MAIPPYEKITESEYRYGMTKRVMPDDVNEETWYNIRHSGPEAVARGTFAVGFLAVVQTIRPIDDSFELTVAHMDEDGRVIASGDALFTDNGILLEPEEPKSEGYLMDYDGYVDGPLIAAAEEQNTYHRVH